MVSQYCTKCLQRLRHINPESVNNERILQENQVFSPPCCSWSALNNSVPVPALSPSSAILLMMTKQPNNLWARSMAALISWRVWFRDSWSSGASFFCLRLSCAEEWHYKSTIEFTDAVGCRYTVLGWRSVSQHTNIFLVSIFNCSWNRFFINGISGWKSWNK